MPMVIVGVLLLVAKLAEFGPFATWPWWVILAPFLAAVLWWQFADSTGLTKKREIDKMERRKADRRERAMQALGLDHRREKQVSRARHDAAKLASADPTQRDNSGTPAPSPASVLGRPPPAAPAAPAAPPVAAGDPGARKEPRL